jgi:cell division transport system permease protein
MMVIAVGVAGILIEAVIHLEAIEDRIVPGFEVEVFLDAVADSSVVQGIGHRLSNLSQVRSVEFISQEEALNRFRETMGVNLSGTMGQNPLPSSFRVSFSPTCSAETIDSLARVVQSWSGCDEVVYPKQLIYLISSLRRKVNSTGVGVAAGCALLAFILTAVVFRLSIHSEREKIQVMFLLGASRAMIRGPFLLAGVMLGAVGGIIAALVLVGIALGVRHFFQVDLVQNWMGGAVMVAGGMVWGFLASYAAVVWGIRSI